MRWYEVTSAWEVRGAWKWEVRRKCNKYAMIGLFITITKPETKTFSYQIIYLSWLTWLNSKLLVASVSHLSSFDFFRLFSSPRIQRWAKHFAAAHHLACREFCLVDWVYKQVRSMLSHARHKRNVCSVMKDKFSKILIKSWKIYLILWTKICQL